MATLNAKDESSGADPMAIAELMLGKKIDAVFPEKCQETGEELISVQDLSLDGKFHDISFSVRKGEIVGVFGLVGSGVEELAKTLFGIFQPSGGTISIHRTKVRLKSPTDAINKGIFLIPGDRRTEGLIAVEPMYFNVSLSNLKRIAGALGLIKGRSEKADVKRLIEQLAVAPPDVNKKVSFLSGGNQQKVVICKGLFTEAGVYIFAEPTTGVDVGAKSSIYTLMRELSKNAAVILISSDCTEVYGMADRSMVMFKGRVTMDEQTCDVREEEMLLCGVKGSATGGQ